MSEDRSTFLGGSDISAVLGISPWATAVDVWEEKTAIDAGYPGAIDPERARRLRRGQRLEPLIIEMAQEELDLFVIARNCRIHHGEYRYLSAQIDFIYTDDETDQEHYYNGECKSVDPRAAGEWGESGSQDVPTYCLAQVMWGLAITGRREAMILALIGDDLRWYKFERDEELCAALIEKGVEFWTKHVIARVPPPITTKDDASKLIRRFQGFCFEAPEELQTMAFELMAAKRTAKNVADEVKDREVSLLQRICNAAETLGDGTAPDKIGVTANGRMLLTWNLQKRAGYSVGPAEFRVLRLKGDK